MVAEPVLSEQGVSTTKALKVVVLETFAETGVVVAVTPQFPATLDQPRTTIWSILHPLLKLLPLQLMVLLDI